jgi:flagellar secretion chaperone FliS
MTENANLAYRETDAITTDPVGLVVVLYDILLKDLNESVAALSVGDVERRSNAIRHAFLVLQQLQGTLNFERGGVVAENLDRFYNFTRAKLLEAQIKASAETIEQQIVFVSSIREAWQQVRAEELKPTEEPGAETFAMVPPPSLEPDTRGGSAWTA